MIAELCAVFVFLSRAIKERRVQVVTKDLKDILYVSVT